MIRLKVGGNTGIYRSVGRDELPGRKWEARRIDRVALCHELKAIQLVSSSISRYPLLTWCPSTVTAAMAPSSLVGTLILEK